MGEFNIPLLVTGRTSRQKIIMNTESTKNVINEHESNRGTNWTVTESHSFLVGVKHLPKFVTS